MVKDVVRPVKFKKISKNKEETTIVVLGWESMVFVNRTQGDLYGPNDLQSHERYFDWFCPKPTDGVGYPFLCQLGLHGLEGSTWKLPILDVNSVGDDLHLRNWVFDFDLTFDFTDLL